jgi:very-short-patch-repair endonuclease
VVTRRELLGAGLSAKKIDHRVAIGLLIVEFRGVYRAGHDAPSVEARYLAAAKACGEGAVLSGLAAAWLWGLTKGPAPPPEVTTTGRRRSGGVKTHRRRTMNPRDATRHRGIPVTTVPVTLLALPSLLSFENLIRAVHEADVRYATRPEHVEQALMRHPNATGAKTLRRIMYGDEPVTLSELEKRFLAVLREHGLPLPETNRPAGTKRVDCRWPEHKLTVELDSYRYHRSRHAWEQDRVRDREARARGDSIRRYTWGDVVEHPGPMVAELRALLSP